MEKANLIIVIPCYNEEDALPRTSQILSAKILQLINENRIKENSSLLFVDDGSTDNTQILIEKLCKENPAMLKGIKLFENTGHQAALLQGLIEAAKTADVTVSIDADLQDDVDAIDEMLDFFYSGYDVVYGVRSDRKADGFFKRTSAQVFYVLMRVLGVKLIYNHADFRLMSRSAVKTLIDTLKGRENNLFLRGIIPELRLKTAKVYYTRQKRLAGKSKYNLQKMLKLAWVAIFHRKIF